MKKNESPLIMASLLSNAWRERNPFVQMMTQIQETIHRLLNIKKDMRAMNQRLLQKQQQLDRMTELVEGPEKPSGNKINTQR